MRRVRPAVASAGLALVVEALAATPASQLRRGKGRRAGRPAADRGLIGEVLMAFRSAATAALACAGVLASPAPARAETYFVALDGSDESGDGSSERPFRTIGHAVGSGIPAAGGDVVVVRDGVYEGRTAVGRGFPAWVTVRAETPYGVVLTNVAGGGEALRVHVSGSARITFEGFVFTNRHPSYACPDGREPYYLIHLQDASDLVLRDNVVFGNNAPGTCNELLKINRSGEAFVRNVVVQGNLFFEPADAPGSDMIDAVRPGEVDVIENVFVGSPSRDGSHSFITLKRQAPGEPSRSPRFVVARNVFLSWGGAPDQAFVQLGEDGVAEEEVTDALVENNLFIGNSGARQSAPVQLKGAGSVTIRANTVVGDLPSGAFALRVGTEGENPAVAGFWIRNNVFCDPTGTMGSRLVSAYGLVDLSSIVLERNLYWNAGAALPAEGAVGPADDAFGLVADPLLETDQSGIPASLFDPETRRFASGAASIRDELLRLVEAYGALGERSPAIGAADPAHMPETDIRGLPRDSAPDLGAYERGAEEPSDAGPDGGADADADGDADAEAEADADAESDAESGGEAGGEGGGGGGCGCRAGARVGSAGALPWLGAILGQGAIGRPAPSARWRGRPGP